MKKPWQSKTHWTALIIAIVSFIPGVSEYVSAHPQVSILVQVLVMVVLRWFSDGKIQLTSNPLIPVMIFSLAFLGIGSCQKNVVDASPMALESGQATMVFGGCSRQMAMGYDVCQLLRGQKLPILQLGFLNAGEWAVSDCRGGLYKQGATDKAGMVEVDLSGLQTQAESARACWLRIESVEHYADAKDPSQKHMIALAGGFIVEFLAPGYMPVFASDLDNWCYKVSRTTSGRTLVEPCK